MIVNMLFQITLVISHTYKPIWPDKFKSQLTCLNVFDTIHTIGLDFLNVLKADKRGDFLNLTELTSRLIETPIVAAVKSEQELNRALKSDCCAVFVLYGNIIQIGGIVERIKQSGKVSFVHVDLIDGLAQREIAIDFIAGNASPDGIISTKAVLLRQGKKRGLLTIQRIFLLDSLALLNIQRQLESGDADIVEILPGVMPKIIRKVASNIKKPVIAGGLIEDKEDIMNALGAGALAVSSTNPDIWKL